MADGKAEPRLAESSGDFATRRLSLWTWAVLHLGLMYCAYAWANLELTQGSGMGLKILRIAPGCGVLVLVSRDSESPARLGVLTGFAAFGATLYLWHWKWIHLTGGICRKHMSCNVRELLWSLLFVSFSFVVALLVAARRSTRGTRRAKYYVNSPEERAPKEPRLRSADKS